LLKVALNTKNQPWRWAVMYMCVRRISSFSKIILILVSEIYIFFNSFWVENLLFLNMDIMFTFILQSVHLLYKYAIRINVCFIRTRRINFSYYTNKLFSLRINFPGTL
jgi:hypothetical protein